MRGVLSCAPDRKTRLALACASPWWEKNAPWHYGPISAGQPAQTIEHIPLERCIGPGVVLDMAHKADNDPITVADMEAALAKTGARLTDETIVLIRTGRDCFLGTKKFWKVGTGMSAAATEWLLDRGVTMMGIDQWDWDLPIKTQIGKSRSTGDSTLFWEAHRVGQRRPYWHGAAHQPRSSAATWV